MCGRFAFFASSSDVVKQFGVSEPISIEPRFNVSPTQLVPVVFSDGDDLVKLKMLRWGLIPYWAKDKSIGNRLINARVETISQKPAFREAFFRRRCLVLASGFYEWRNAPGGKEPFYIRRSDNKLMGFAGLREVWQSDYESKLETVTIVTTKANFNLAEIHNRMPIILSSQKQRLWLDKELLSIAKLDILMANQDIKLDIYPVSKAVNKSTAEGKYLINATTNKL
tara:strand:- start:5049 stop:5723 length:675 start_codon:yes stop_codon:yes gene_type:complete